MNPNVATPTPGGRRAIHIRLPTDLIELADQHAARTPGVTRTSLIEHGLWRELRARGVAPVQPPTGPIAPAPAAPQPRRVDPDAMARQAALNQAKDRA